MNALYLLKFLSLVISINMFFINLAADTINNEQQKSIITNSYGEKFFAGKLSKEEENHINSSEILQYIEENVYIDKQYNKRNGNFLLIINGLEDRGLIEVKTEKITIKLREEKNITISKILNLKVIKDKEQKLKQYFEELYQSIVHYNNNVVPEGFEDQNVIKQSSENKKESTILEFSKFNGKPETKEQSCQTEEQKQ